ncbi:NAD(P)-binding protein [Pyrenochaeta sp. DS3sAY3a]|nr:NAD(P)-binding protein [Pyrenochaeta sp. DS3sAY3a]
MPPRAPHILITGGSKGIGLSTAHLFASHGYRCTLLSRSSSALKAAVSSLPPLAPAHAAGPGHAYIVGDIKSSDFWDPRSSAPESFGRWLPKPHSKDEAHASRIDVLVNCAGITQTRLFTGISDDDIRNIMDTNLTGMITGTRALIRNGYLRGKQIGTRAQRIDGPDREAKETEASIAPVIINVSSLLGLQGGYGAVAYAASKAGVLGFTRALATEYAVHGVRVNAIVPGYVETDMTKSLNASVLAQKIPLGRLGKPDEIAQAALFLAENQYAHNCILNLDGGLSAF